MRPDEFAKTLGIDKEGKYYDDVYVIQLEDSNEFARMYSRLDKNENLDLDPEGIDLGTEGSTLVYLSDEFDVMLKSDFGEEYYAVEISEAKE